MQYDKLLKVLYAICDAILVFVTIKKSRQKTTALNTDQVEIKKKKKKI